MLESLVTTLLNRFLGAYISNLNYNQMRIGIWNGEVKLNNLQLKKEALDKFDLPIDVVRGHLGELTLSIPWSNLKTKPVQVYIKDVYVLAVPRNESTITAEEERRRAQQRKQEKLANAELIGNSSSIQKNSSSEEKSNPQEEAKNDSFMNQLVSKIVDNLQISLNNIHVRYEDEVSNPGHPFAAGVTLSEISAISTNGDWIPTFISELTNTTHKLATLESLSVYLNTDTELLAEVSPEDFVNKFYTMISKADNIQSDNHYVLKPVSGTGKVKLNKQYGGAAPKFDVNMLFEELGFVLNEEQYADAILTVDQFHAALKRQQYRALRPEKPRTPKSHPKEFLQFAQKAVLEHIHDKNYRWSWDHFRQRRDDRKEYISSYVANALGKATAKQKEALKKLEEKLSFEDIRFYRSMSKSQLKRERATIEKNTKAQQSVAKKGSGWISNWWHGNSNQQTQEGGEDENTLEVTEEQRQELYDAIDWDEEKATVAMSVDMPKDTMKAQIHVKLKRGSFALGSSPHKKNRDDLVTLVFDTVTADITQYVDSMKISAGLGDLRLYDGSTKGTLYKKMIGVKTRNQRSVHLTNLENQRLEEAFDKNPTDLETDPFFSVVFEKKPLDGRADNAVTVKMHHLEIIYNPAIVNEVIRFFKPPETNMETVNALIEVAGTTLDSWKKQTRAGLEYALESHTTFDLRVDMDAPIIMVPEDCTKKNAWVLVIDAGHINVESNLAPKEAIDKVLAKQGQEYSEEDFKELESLVYDKFTIKLTDTKVLIADSVETSRKEIQNPSGGDMHVIEQIDMDFLCETCIVPKSTQLTKIKISGHLPLISINFSDQKYKTLMNVIDIIVPSIDDDDMETSNMEDAHDASNQSSRPKRAMSSSLNDGQRAGNSSSTFGKPVWGAVNEEPLFISDSEDSDNETLHETSDNPSRHLSTPSSFHVSSSKPVDDSEVSNEYKQTNFSLSFKIDRVKASLKEARSSETNQEMLLCDLVLEQFLLVFTQRKFDMTVDVSLKTLNVIDQMEHGREFTYLITSDEIRSDSSTSIKEKNLVTVKYRKINPNSPEYCDIDQSVDVELSALNIVVTRSSILTLYNFILSTFTTPTKEPTSGASIASGKHSRRDSAKSVQDSIKNKPQDQPNENSENGGGVIKVQICLESLDLILNDDGVRLATGCLSHGDVIVVVKPNTLNVDVKIRNFELKDDLTSPYVDPSNLETDLSKTQLLSLEGQELATFRYATFDKESERYPGYDQLIFLRMGSLRLNFLEHTVHQLVDYGARFAEMKVVYDSAREAAVSSAQQFQQTESLLHFDVRIRSPTLIFPSTDPKRPKDQLVARLGEVSVENTFSNQNLATEQLQRSDKSVLENSIRARVDSVDLKSEFVLKDPDTEEEHKQSLSILEELHMDFKINIVPHTAGTLRPDTQITGHISDICMNLTESQFKFLMATSNSVTAAFTTSNENTDEAELVNEDPLTMEAIRSVGVTGDGNEPSSGALKDAVQSDMHEKRQSSTDEKDDIWTTLDMTIDFQGIKLELFNAEGSLQQEDLSEWSLASFSLEDSGFKLCTNSDSSMFLELQVASLVLNDTRANIHSEFREIMKRARIDGPQLQLRYETTPRQDTTDQFLLLALDTPQIILSVDHVFELQKYLMAPFTVEEATEAQMFAESQKQREANESTEPAGGQQSVSRMKQTNKSQNDKQSTSTQGVLRYKINIVDPEIILLANPAVEDSEAIVLSAEQVLISQESLLTVNVSKIGMFLCAMNNKEAVKIRFVDEFEISVSMESHTSANHNITSIIIDIQALVLRVSYLDISIITNVVNRAIELMGSSESAPSPVEDRAKDDEIENNDDVAGNLAPPTEARSINTSGLKKRTNIEPYIVMSRETLKLSCQGIQVILIEDLHELPIIDMNLKPFTVMVSDWTKALLVDASFSLYTGFYNAKNSHWEPLIEPWSFNLKVSKALTSDSLDIELASKRKIEIDLTHSFVEAMLNFTSTTGGQKRFDVKRGSLKPYCIQNRTGHAISVWNSKSRELPDEKYLFKIEDGDDLPWAFSDWRQQREMELSTFGNNSLGVTFDGKMWDPLRSIAVDSQGEHPYLLRPKVNQISHRLIVDIKIVDHVKVVTLRSGLLIQNDTLVPIEISTANSRGDVQKSKGIIQPEDEYAVPIDQCYDSWFLIRPNVDGYKWSKMAMHWSDLTHPKAPDSIECECTDIGPPSFRFHMNSIFDKKDPLAKRYPFMKIRISAPLEIENLLPFDFTYRVLDKDSGQDFSSVLEQGGRSPLHIIDLSHLMLLSVEIHNTEYQVSEPMVISSHKRNEIATEQIVSLLDKSNHALHLKMKFSDIAGAPGARRLSIYSPYVIINKTRSPIRYKYKPFLQNSKLSPGQESQDNGSSQAIQPFMFSFPKEDRRNRALIQVGNSGWSQPLSFEAVGSVQEISVPSSDDNEIFLGISISEGQGKFLHTKLITITPRYIVRNNLGIDIRYKEAGSEEDYFLSNGGKNTVHELSKSNVSKCLSIKSVGLESQWSAPFNLNHIGTFHVQLDTSDDSEIMLAKVSVLLEDATIFIVIGKETGKWPYLIINESSVDVALFQQSPSSKEEELAESFDYKPKLYDLKSGSSMKYAWDFPSVKDKKIVISIAGKTRPVDIKEIGHQVPFRYHKSRRNPGIMAMDVVARGTMQILRLSDYDQSASMFKLKSSTASSRDSTIVDDSIRETFEEVEIDHVINYTFKINLHGIGISVINQRLQEMAYVSLKDLEIKLTDSSIYQSLRVAIQWLQIDNQFFGSAYPILLYPTVIPQGDSENMGYPTFHFAVDKVKDSSHGVLYLKYFSILLQEITFEMDEDFLFGLMEFSKFNVPGWESSQQRLVSSDSMDIPDPKVLEEAEELYFEVLNIQPMRLNLSFVRTERINAPPIDESHSGDSPIMFVFNVLTMTIGSINDAPVKLNALAAENMRVSYNDLVKRMTLHYGEQVVYQIHKVLGSADVIGNPVGLFNTLSSGVAELFYEPYQGVIMSDRPQDLGIGVARGVGGFFKKSVFGFSDSFSKVTGSIGKGLAVATMDRKFQDRRRANMTRNRPKHAMYGVTQGVNQFGTSVASGVAGLVKRPVEGANEEGVTGFVTGVGKGLVGVVTKPVVGMFDLANNVSQGVRNTTTIFDVNDIDRFRLPRYIASDGILRPYSQREALGQSWLKDLANGKFFNEVYVSHCMLTTNELAAMLTNSRIMVINARKSTLEWQEHFSEIDTIQYRDTGIIIKLRNTRSEPFIPIPEITTCKWFFSKIEDAVAQWGEQQNLEL